VPRRAPIDDIFLKKITTMKAEIDKEFLDSTTPDSLKSAFQKIDAKSLSESRERMNKESKENSKILELYNNDSFILNKDLLILTGTIFGSSIALATGRIVNNFFIFGELFLFLSIVSGLIILLTHLKAKEWDYAFSSKNSLESYLLLNKKRIEKFELEATENLMEDYKKIMKSNQKGLLYFLLKHVSVEKWPTLFSTTFLLGVFLILLSLIPSQSITGLISNAQDILKTLK